MKKFPAALVAAAMISTGLGLGVGVAAPAHAVAAPLTTPSFNYVAGDSDSVYLDWDDPNLTTNGLVAGYHLVFTADDGSGTTYTADVDLSDVYTSGTEVTDTLDYSTIGIPIVVGAEYDVTVAAGSANTTAYSDSLPSAPETFSIAKPSVQTPDDLTLTGSWTVGSTLTAAATPYPGDTSAGAWTPGSTVTYSWILDPKDTYSTTAGYQYFQGTVFATTTTPSIVLPAAALGHVIGVRAVGTKAGYEDSATMTNNYWSLHTVTAGQLRMGTPAITGKAKVGKKVAVSTGTWTAGTTFSYQWLANGKPIKGKKAKKSVLKLTKKLKGQKISVQVTAFAPAGYTPATVKAGTVVTTKAKKVK